MQKCEWYCSTSSFLYTSTMDLKFVCHSKNIREVYWGIRIIIFTWNIECVWYYRIRFLSSPKCKYELVPYI